MCDLDDLLAAVDAHGCPGRPVGVRRWRLGVHPRAQRRLEHLPEKAATAAAEFVLGSSPETRDALDGLIARFCQWCRP
jgi:hypothetical protein